MPICLHPKQPPRPFSLPHIHSTYLSLSPPRDYCARTESLVTDRVFGHGQSLWSYMCRIVATMSKETYYSGKRDLLECQMRPSTVSNETYYSVETELLHGQSLWSYVSESRHASISLSLSHTCICLSLSRMHAHVCRFLSLSYMELSASCPSHQFVSCEALISLVRRPLKPYTLHPTPVYILPVLYSAFPMCICVPTHLGGQIYILFSGCPFSLSLATSPLFHRQPQRVCVHLSCVCVYL